MQTGFGLHDDGAGHETEVVIALMRVFTKEACEIAAICAAERGTRHIDGENMRRALMYVSRTFFQNKSDEELNDIVQAELVQMDESTETEDTEDSASEEEDANDKRDGVVTVTDSGMLRRVAAVAECWSLWKPTDPVQQLLKRAIDATAVQD